jgi:hypothetical protein
MRREKCCHVTYVALAESIDSSQVESLLLCRLSARIHVFRWLYLFRSRYLEKGSKT